MALVPSSSSSSSEVALERRDESSHGKRVKRSRFRSPSPVNGLMNGYDYTEVVTSSSHRQNGDASFSIVTRSSTSRSYRLDAVRNLVSDGYAGFAKTEQPKNNRKNGKYKEVTSAKSASTKNGSLSKKCEWLGCTFVATSSSESLLLHVQRHITVGTRCLWSGCASFDKPARKNRWLRDHVVDRHCETRLFHCPVGGCSCVFKSDELLEFHVMYAHCEEENESLFHHRMALAALADERERRQCEQLPTQFVELLKSTHRGRKFYELIGESFEIPAAYMLVLRALYSKKEWDNFSNGIYDGQGLQEFVEAAMDLLLKEKLAVVVRK
ncbi:hypothetical protein TTRE_0000334001 [Trichuris trichiura]|uniref:C2H2-type domain-containing protein n=1 Tax=Trichuris trichiura TaxID=36087 RepID=A0A077Z5G7_TRITR|nr:hypothetical protein TTRE_0000334001 [Trichuris trichiura]